MDDKTHDQECTVRFRRRVSVGKSGYRYQHIILDIPRDSYIFLGSPRELAVLITLDGPIVRYPLITDRKVSKVSRNSMSKNGYINGYTVSLPDCPDSYLGTYLVHLDGEDIELDKLI